MHQRAAGGVPGVPKLNGDSDVLGLAEELLVTQHSQERASFRFEADVLL